jgi:hypothetical protein
MSYLIAEMLEAHDRQRFTVTGYCSSPEDGSPVRRRILAAFDAHRPIRSLDDAAAARLIRDDEIDILVDLNGLTAGSRLGILRWKPAPGGSLRARARRRQSAAPHVHGAPMQLHPDLTGRVALVTGASRGIGRAIALALAEAGASVAVNYRSAPLLAQQVADDIRARGRRSLALEADVSRPAAVERLVGAVVAALGPIDVLVNNAGIAIVRGLDDLTEADFDETLAVNLKSAFLCTQAVLPGMRQRR